MNKIVSNLLVPTLLIISIVILTLILFQQKGTALTYKNMFVGESSKIPKLIPINSWAQYYNGGAGTDKVITYDKESLRITTKQDGGWYGAYTNLKRINLNKYDLRFAVRASDWKQLERFAILISTGDGFFQNYFSLNLRQYFSNPENNEWIELIVDGSDFIVAEGNPDWSNITSIGIRIIPTEGEATRVWIDGFALIPKTELGPIVTLSFDDGFDSTFWAKEKMKEYGYKGTLYVIPDLLDTDGYLQQNQVDILSEEGWDISGHFQTDLREFSHPDLDTILYKIHDYLKEHNYKGMNNFAYPNGSYNRSVQSQVMEYFNTGRTIDGFAQSQGYILPSKINAKTVSSKNSIEEIKKWVDISIEEKSWLNIVWHDLVDQDSDVDTEYKKEDFEELLKYLDNKGVEVTTFSEAYNRIISQIK